MMPKAKKRSAAESNGPMVTQWAPIATVQMPQPPRPPRNTSAFHSPVSERPPGSSIVRRASDIRFQPPVVPGTGPTASLHYFSDASSSGSGTPTGGWPGASNSPSIPNYDTPSPRQSVSSFPGAEYHGPGSHALPSVESSSPQLSAGRHTPASEGHPPHPPGVQASGSRTPVQPPVPAQHRPSAHRSPNQARSHRPRPTRPTGPPQFRSLTGDEVRRTQRFMSLNWRVGVINHAPTVVPRYPPHSASNNAQPQASGSQFAGFVGQSRS